MWQPFFHSIFAYTDSEDKHLYFCQNVTDADPRFEIQSVFKTVQNVSNTTGTPFGSFIMHYEIDFYYPETVQIEAAAVTYPTLFQWESPANAAIAQASWGSPALPSTSLSGDIYQAVVTVLVANSTNSFFTGLSSGIAVGLTVYFRALSNGAQPLFRIYSTLATADQGTDTGALCWAFTGTIPADNAACAFVVLGKVSASNLALVRSSLSEEDDGAGGLKTHPKDETPQTKFPAFTITNYMPPTQLPNLNDVAHHSGSSSRAVVVPSSRIVSR